MLAKPRRCQQFPFPPDYAHRCIHRSWHDTDRSNGVLGTDGFRDHGRLVGRDDSNADLSAYIVCDLVQRNRKTVRPFFDSGIKFETRKPLFQGPPYGPRQVNWC